MNTDDVVECKVNIPDCSEITYIGKLRTIWDDDIELSYPTVYVDGKSHAGRCLVFIPWEKITSIKLLQKA